MSDAIEWTGGGSARVVSANGMLVEVHSTRPFPPGAPVPGTLTADGAHAFTLKVAAARKIAETTWAVRGRLLTPTAAVIAAFAQAARAHTG